MFGPPSGPGREAYTYDAVKDIPLSQLWFQCDVGYARASYLFTVLTASLLVDCITIQIEADEEGVNREEEWDRFLPLLDSGNDEEAIWLQLAMTSPEDLGIAREYVDINGLNINNQRSHRFYPGFCFIAPMRQRQGQGHSRVWRQPPVRQV